MAFKSGHEDITYIKADASFNHNSTQTVEANGIRGLLSVTLGAAFANGTAIDFTLTNSFIESDSVINCCVCKKGESASYIPMVTIPYNLADGSCKIRVINAVGIELAADKIIHLAYEVVN